MSRSDGGARELGRSGGDREVRGRHRVGAGEGYAFEIKAGESVAFSLPAGSQVIDLNVFHAADMREHFGSSVTRGKFGIHPTSGDALYSCLPWARPMLLIVDDSVRDIDDRPEPARRARSHDLLFGRCSRASRRRKYGSDTPGCQEILADAIAPFGLANYDVHDPFNIFMRTGLDDDGKPFWTAPSASTGDRVELEAAMGCVMAMSACPGQSSGAHPGGFELTIFTAAGN